MTAVYVGNLDVGATVNDLHREFDRYGRIKDVWVARKPPGFAFVEFEDERDARDAVKDMDGRWILDKRIRAEISRRGRGERREEGGHTRGPPRRTDYRVKITGLADSVGWRELKDMLRDIADPAFVDTFGNGDGVAEFMSSGDVDRVISKLDDTKFHGSYIRLREDTGGSSRDRDSDRDRDRGGRDRDDRDDRSGRDRERGRDRDDRDDRGDRDRDRNRDDKDDPDEKRRSVDPEEES